ncbi:hypothetical protein [Pantoea sp. C2G6]|uniref:hypothetical protein n=1 Tax=Pantoea sp. C2G6 TaxID=3243084 RepID=UPI003EDB2FF9
MSSFIRSKLKKHIKMWLVFLVSLFPFSSIAAINCSAGWGDYPYNLHQEPAPKKAQSKGRIYFYSLPKIDCKTSTFIINNDEVLKYRESNGYSYVNFVNKNGAVVDGWVKMSTSSQPIKRKMS